MGNYQFTVQMSTVGTSDGEGYDIETLLIHGDEGVEDVPDLAPPIHTSTTFKYMNTNNPGNYLYTRYDQPTRSRLETVLGKLEEGFAVTYSSGTAAGFAALMYYRPQRVFIDKGYMGTHHSLQAYFSPTDPKWFNRILLLQPDIVPQSGDLLWLETPKNPNCLLEDISHYSKLAHLVGAHVLVDSTFATPILQQPLKLGADMVMHSCTKFLSGHSDVLAGALIVKTENIAYQLTNERGVTGAILGNLESYLLLRSLRELDIRIERQVKNAIQVAAFLATHKKVAKVWHPSLPDHPSYALCNTQMKKPPGILSFELEREDQVQIFLKHLKLISVATSLGGVHTSIDWRYRWDTKQEPTLVRLSIGIESKRDIINDLDQALNKLT